MLFGSQITAQHMSTCADALHSINFLLQWHLNSSLLYDLYLTFQHQDSEICSALSKVLMMGNIIIWASWAVACHSFHIYYMLAT